MRGREAYDLTTSPHRRWTIASVFTRIIRGDLPGRFVWRDDRCVAFLSISPLKPGHTLVVPIEEVDHWIDLDPDMAAHLFEVARKLGKAIQHAFAPTKVALMIAGLEVRHAHLHLVPIVDLHDLDFERQDRNPDPAELDRAADQVGAALHALGLQP